MPLKLYNVISINFTVNSVTGLRYEVRFSGLFTSFMQDLGNVKMCKISYIKPVYTIDCLWLACRFDVVHLALQLINGH